MDFIYWVYNPVTVICLCLDFIEVDVCTDLDQSGSFCFLGVDDAVGCPCAAYFLVFYIT